jgi:hypothetical protein
MTAPIRREVIVAIPPDHAFALFTDEIGRWWPVHSHSVYQGSVTFEGDVLVERTADAETTWAEVTGWNPPHSLALDWHPGGTPDRATQLRVEFIEHGDGTLVRLVHDGWDRLVDPEAASQDYGEGWIVVLGHFAESVQQAA